MTPAVIAHPTKEPDAVAGAAAAAAAVDVAADRPVEETTVHTRLLRLALGQPESRAYWEHIDPGVPPPRRAAIAFEQRWFGGKSLPWVRVLLANFAARYDAFPDALHILRAWSGMDAATRQVICHIHLQLSDPMYRRYTGEFLPQRRSAGDGPRPMPIDVSGQDGGGVAHVDRDSTLRWLRQEFPGRWSDATQVQFASKLLSAASEAGLVSPKRDPRTLPLPKVTDAALGYVLHLLRGTRIAGTLTDNPYLASLGLNDGFLDGRLRQLPGVKLRRMGGLTEFDWNAADLPSWAQAQGLVLR